VIELKLGTSMVRLLLPWATSVAVLARKIWGHDPMASAVARAYNGGRGRAPSGAQRQSPWSGGQGGEAPLKLKHFRFLNIQWKPQICPHFWTLETQIHQIFVLSLQKIMDGRETGGPGAKLGEGPMAPRPGPKTATGQRSVISILVFLYK